MSENTKQDFNTICQIASGMLYQDRYWLKIIAGILAIPPFLIFLITRQGLDITLTIQALDRLTQIAVIYLVGRRWIIKFSKNKNFPLLDSKKILLLFAIGITLWLLLQIPLITLVLAKSTSIKMFAITIWIPAILLAISFYFYFMPILLGEDKLRNIANLSLNLFKTDRLGPIKTMLAPLGIVLIITSILSAFSPDESLKFISDLKNFSSVIFFILTTYLALATGFYFLNHSDWRGYDLDPYKSERFSTLTMQGYSWLAKMLTPNNGLKFLAIALLVGLGNMASLSNMGPKAEINISSLVVKDQKIIIGLDLKDPEYNLRGFSPLLITIAGPNVELISESRLPEQVKVNGEIIDLSMANSLAPADSANIELTFSTNRSEENLKKLEDLFLWYRQVKVTKIDFR